MSLLGTTLKSMYGFYDVAFQPILALGPYISLGIFSAALAFVFSLIYWYLLDIEKQDKLKDKIKKKQEAMKEARKNEESEKASEKMQETMKLNQKMMMLNFKPMVATMVFVALIFPWLGATFAPTVPLDTQDNQTFTGEFNYAGQTKNIEVINNTNSSITINGASGQVGEKVNLYGVDWDITYFGESKGGLFSIYSGPVLKMNARFVELPFSIPLAGEALNWLGFYIVLAMPLTFIFRKLLGVQ